MITQLEIENYQSIRKLSLPVGKFNVVTGPSSAGKSASIRAARLLAFNAPGTSYITRGAKTATVGIAGGDWAVTITRGVTRGKDAYRVGYTDVVMGEPGPASTTYTKLAGKVPEPVSALLNLTELNFAGQFDRPYLLTESAGKVAAQLGELTNVTLLFDAAREANTRRQRLSRQLDDARAELARLKTEAQRFRGLKQRQQLARDLADALEKQQATARAAHQLRTLRNRWTTTQDYLGTLEKPHPLPATDPLEALTARRTRLHALILAHSQALQHQRNAEYAAARERIALNNAEAELRTVLKDAGICPTCGQVIKEGSS